MAANTRRIGQSDATRAKIQVTQLINRLQANANGELPKEMTPGQVRSAQILLNKALPDLTLVTYYGEMSKHYAVSAEPMSENEWEREYGDGDNMAPPAGASEKPH